MALDGISKTESRFVGREKELKNISRLIREAATGNGQFIAISGEAGIGKTRFVSEASTLALEEGFEFVAGHCLSLEQTEPYQPFMEALAGKMVTSKEEDSHDIPLGLMGIGDSRPSAGVPLGLIPFTESSSMDKINIQSERDKIFEKVLGTMERSSLRKPLFLFINDLQWADTGTLQMLVYIARNIANSRIVLCTAFRTGEVDAEGRPLQFYEQFNQAMRNIAINQITLDRMSSAEIADMIRGVLNITNLPQQFSDKLYAESSGNPYFVEEVLRSLMDEGIILRHGHIWDAGIDMSRIRIPNTIRDVICHRIARLCEDDTKILRYAAVVGDSFSFVILKEITGIPEEQLLDSIDRLMMADIIQEVPNTSDEEYRFDHKLIRSVIYDELSQSRVRLMHKTVGEGIERLYPDQLMKWAFDLARHFNLGKHTQKTYNYSIMAGDQAFKGLAFDRAVEYYITALRTMDMLTPSEGFNRDAEKVRISMLVGNLYYGLGLWNSSVRFFEDALKVAEKTGNDAIEVKALISLGHSKRSAGNNREAEKDYIKAAEIAGKREDMQSMGEIQRGLGYVHWRKGENDNAIEHYNQSISFSMKAGDLSSMAKTFTELGNVYNTWGQYEKAIEYYGKSISEMEKLNDYFELARAYNNIGDTYLHLKEWDRAIESLDKCRHASEKIGNRNMVAWAMFNSAEALANIGELDKAENYCITALNICESQDDKIGMNGVFRCFGIIYRFKKLWNKAIDNINKSIVILEMLDIPHDLANTYFELGLVYREMGEFMGAIDNFGIAKNYFESVGAKNMVEETTKIIKELEAAKK